MQVSKDGTYTCNVDMEVDYSKVVSDCHEEPVRLFYDPILPMSQVNWYCSVCGCTCKAIVITDQAAYDEQSDDEVFGKEDKPWPSGGGGWRVKP